MGYKSDVRIIVSKNGFEKLKEFVKNYLKEKKNDETVYNLLENCNIKQEGKEQYYFGWNRFKWDEGYTEVDAIINGLSYLRENEYSYRYMKIGEGYDDIENLYYNGKKDEKVNLEYPCMIREFDDEYVMNLIKPNSNELQKEETIELRIIWR